MQLEEHGRGGGIEDFDPFLLVPKMAHHAFVLPTIGTYKRGPACLPGVGGAPQGRDGRDRRTAEVQFGDPTESVEVFPARSVGGQTEAVTDDRNHSLVIQGDGNNDGRAGDSDALGSVGDFVEGTPP